MTTRYLVVIELDGSPGRDDERERKAFEDALQRGYEKANRVGYSELKVVRFKKIDALFMYRLDKVSELLDGLILREQGGVKS